MFDGCYTMSQTIFSMETFKIFSNLAIISNKGMLNQVIAVITAVLGHFDDHGNQLTAEKTFHLIEPLEFINLIPHLSFYFWHILRTSVVTMATR